MSVNQFPETTVDHLLLSDCSDCIQQSQFGLIKWRNFVLLLQLQMACSGTYS